MVLDKGSRKAVLGRSGHHQIKGAPDTSEETNQGSRLL